MILSSPQWPIYYKERVDPNRWIHLTTVSNKKNPHLAVFETYISRTTRARKKRYLHQFASSSEELSDEKELFKSGHKISWYLQKRCFARKNKAIGKNLPFWKIKKLFFMDLRFRNCTYIQTSFWLKNRHATSSSQARCVFHIFVNQISISCRNNNEQIRYLFLSMCCLLIGHIFDKKFFFIS